MEEKIVIEKSASIGEAQLILIIKVTLSSMASKVGTGFFAKKQPVAMVINSLKKRIAFKITGEEVSLEELKKEFPSLTVHLQEY